MKKNSKSRLRKAVGIVLLCTGFFLIISGGIDQHVIAKTQEKKAYTKNMKAEVYIPDEQIRDNIREILYLQPGSPITQEDMIRLTSFSGIFAGKKVNLEGLQYAVNLTSLHFRYAEIDDFTPLQGLNKLASMTIWNSSKVSDLSGLQDLPALKELIIEEAGLNDLTGIGGLTSLTTIELNGNNISDLRPLSNLPKLRSLHLNDNNISDLTPLRTIPSLTELKLMNNELKSLTGLELSNKLEILFVPNNKITDLKALEDTTMLQELHAGNNEISSTVGLEKSNRIFLISLSANKIQDVSGLINKPRLRYLYLEENVISDIAPLHELRGVLDIRLTDNNITDVSPLREVTVMESLVLNGNRISDISPLKEMGVPHLLILNQSIPLHANLTDGQSSWTAKNPIIGKQGVPLIPNAISNLGVYNEQSNEVTWQGLIQETGIRTYKFSETDGILFTGTVTLNYENDMPSYFVAKPSAFTVGTSTHITGTYSGGEAVRMLLFVDGHWYYDAEVGNGKFSIPAQGRINSDSKHVTVALYDAYDNTTGAQQVPLTPASIVPDSALQAYIKKELNLGKEEQITTDNIKKLTKIDLEGKQVKSMEGLQFATNVESINLNGNQIESIPPLKNLTKLTFLSLENNQVKNVSGLSECQSLSLAFLKNNQIKDIKPLATLSDDMWILDLTNNKIQDANPLVGVAAITTLLDRNQISDLSGFAGIVPPYARNQVIILPTMKLTEDRSLSISNPIKNSATYSSNIVSPLTISNGGVYDVAGNKVKWEKIKEDAGVLEWTFDFRADSLSGIVKQPYTIE
ncbi:hypothetical protein HCA69_03365 [Listeria grandensis]|uniref:Internalin n=1 Tax=Listeria grandensis TaxID=1494963 RepID=A0A7X0Y1Q2_9LIST|nr:leucine-rich repeat domain-containing protein [Listeria grandensis]MBC1935390.1 hypothetical protein [Listeria grandensis]